MSRILAFAFSSLVAFILLVAVTQSLIPTRTGVQEQPSTHAALVTDAPGVVESVDVDAEPVSYETTPSHLHPPARPIEVSERQFDRLIWDKGLVLVKFGADWCGPCRKVVPELQRIAEQNTGKLTVLTVDVDKERRLAEKHNVGSIPRLLLFRNGAQIDDWTGYQSAAQIQQGIERAIASQPKGRIQSNPF